MNDYFEGSFVMDVNDTEKGLGEIKERNGNEIKVVYPNLDKPFTYILYPSEKERKATDEKLKEVELTGFSLEKIR